ncbi:MAG TPA: glycosyltransferase family 4 protein [Xanthobacteraceae bacterium]|nr:glycosyltransferase family 4 protein [Xanthobacteraceae bacterium]
MDQITAPWPLKRQIIFINKYFYPDQSATSQILTDLAFHLADVGNRVCVITSQQLYGDPKADLEPIEQIKQVEVHRVPTTRFGRERLVGRGADYLSFYRSVSRVIARVAEPGDILVAKTDPPMLCISARHAAKRCRLRLVNWLQDLYPEIAVELGVPFTNGPIGALLYRMRDSALRAATANVVVGNKMGDRIRARGAQADGVYCIPNWCDELDIRPVPGPDNKLRRDWKLEDHFVLGYSGNLGRGHEFETILAAASRLRDHGNIVFLLMGGGKKFDELAQRVAAQGLKSHFRFLPYQDRSLLRLSLGVPDVHWVSLNPSLEGTIVPSKFYGIAAAGRPIIAITAPDGELARLVQQYRIGATIPPGDGDALARCLLDLQSDPQKVRQMGQRARQMLEMEFSRTQAFDRWRQVLCAIAQGNGALGAP